MLPSCLCRPKNNCGGQKAAGGVWTGAFKRAQPQPWGLWAARCCMLPFPSPSTLRERSLNINHTRPQSAFSGVVFQYQIHNARTEFQHACFVFNYTLAYKHLCAPHLCLPSEHASTTSSCLCRMEMGKGFSRKDGSSAFFSEGFTLPLGERMPSDKLIIQSSLLQNSASLAHVNPSTSELGTQQIH